MNFLCPDHSDRDAFFRIYAESFIEAYADIVSHTGEKPSVVLFEIEAAFVHLVKYEMGTDPDANMKKAKGHLFRATLDCYKLLWRETHGAIAEVDIYKAAYNGKQEELTKKLRERKDATLSARRRELEFVGSEDETVFELWKKAANLSFEIYNNINGDHLEELKHLRLTAESKNGRFETYIFPAMLCAASLVGGFLLGMVF